MAKVVVVGGGFAGCAAAISAAKSGAQTTLVERTDMLLASGMRAGRMNFEGKLVLAEEAKALGAGDVFEALESIILHRENIVEEAHGYVYNTALAEPTVRATVEGAGVALCMEDRAVDVIKEGERVRAVKLESGDLLEGDSFVDCTGSTGGVKVCTAYGGGCAMCMYFRCPTFGDRVSIATQAGAPELMRRRPDGTPGAIGLGAGTFIYKETLSPELKGELEEKKSVRIPLPPDLIDYSLLTLMNAVRTRKQVESINLVDIGPVAKGVPPVLRSLQQLRRIPGLESAEVEGAMKFYKVKAVSMAPRENSLRVKGFANLFCAGEKAGPSSGVAEAIAAGHLAGHNAARAAAGLPPLTLPRTTAIGDFIAYLGEKMGSQEGLNSAYSAGAREYFERMKIMGLYTADVSKIKARIAELGLQGALAQKAA